MSEASHQAEAVQASASTGCQLELCPVDPREIVAIPDVEDLNIDATYAEHEKIFIRLGESYGHRARCMLADIVPSAGSSALSSHVDSQSLSEPVFVKFYQVGTSARWRAIARELAVYSHPELKGHHVQAMGKGRQVQGGLFQTLPRFRGFYSVMPAPAQFPTNKWPYAILLEALPLSYQPIHQLKASLAGDWPMPEALFRSACLALKLLHDCGYVHGDISKGNFLLTLDNLPETKRVAMVDFERTRCVFKNQKGLTCPDLGHRKPHGAAFEAFRTGEAKSLMHLFHEYGFPNDILLPICKEVFSL